MFHSTAIIHLGILKLAGKYAEQVNFKEAKSIYHSLPNGKFEKNELGALLSGP